MNTAIRITCLLIEAAEEGVELKVDGDLLRVRADASIDDDLRTRLRTRQAAIIERLNYDATHPDPFKDFIHECCLFYAGEGMACPIAELDQAYTQWVQGRRHTPLSLVLLHKRMRQLGCEEIRLQAAPWWEHTCVYWPAIDSSPASTEVLADSPEVKQSSPGDAGAPAGTPPTTNTEPANPYSQTVCRDCGGSGVRLQSVCAVGTGWRFALCWKCFSRRYGANPHRAEQ